jgi:hypothetical protein
MWILRDWRSNLPLTTQMKHPILVTTLMANQIWMMIWMMLLTSPAYLRYQRERSVKYYLPPNPPPLSNPTLPTPLTAPIPPNSTPLSSNAQCTSARAEDFPNDESCVTYTLSFLKGTLLDWFQTELNHVMTQTAEFPKWFTSYLRCSCRNSSASLVHVIWSTMP